MKDFCLALESKADTGFESLRVTAVIAEVRDLRQQHAADKLIIPSVSVRVL